MNPEDLSHLLLDVCEIARVAGRSILEVRKSGYEVYEKSDHSPVTTADLVAHRRIADGLHWLVEDWPLLSEEAAQVPWQVRRKWETYWLVDPLDGTRELLRGSPEFTVNIALIHQHQPVLGVIDAPALDRCYYACQGGGAFRWEKEQTAQPIHTRPVPADGSWVVAASRRHAGPQMSALLERLGEYQEQRVGSSLKSCRVAEGSMDLYPRYGPTSEWDTAAAQCILKEAGGELLGWDLKPLCYNRTPSLINPSFMAVGDRHHDWEMLMRGLSSRRV